MAAPHVEQPRHATGLEAGAVPLPAAGHDLAFDAGPQARGAGLSEAAAALGAGGAWSGVSLGKELDAAVHVCQRHGVHAWELLRRKFENLNPHAARGSLSTADIPIPVSLECLGPW